jgi:hypothetical protein
MPSQFVTRPDGTIEHVRTGGKAVDPASVQKTDNSPRMVPGVFGDLQAAGLSGLVSAGQTLMRTGDVGKAIGAYYTGGAQDISRNASPTTRTIVAPIRNLAQNVLGNTPADVVSEKMGRPRPVGASDAKLLGVIPALPKIKYQDPTEELIGGFVQGAMGFYLASRALGMGGGAAMRVPAVAGAAKAVQPLTQAAKAVGSFAKGAPGVTGVAARTALGATSIAAQGALPGAMVDYAGFDAGSTLTDQVLTWVEKQRGTPIHAPLLDLVRSAPGDSAADARWKSGVEGMFFVGPAAGATIEGLGRVAKSIINLANARQASRGADPNIPPEPPASGQTVDVTAAPVGPNAKVATAPNAGPGVTQAAPKSKASAPDVAKAYMDMRPRTPLWEKQGVETQGRLDDPRADVQAATKDFVEATTLADTAVARASSTVPDEAGPVPTVDRGNAMPSYSQVRETPVAEIDTDPTRLQFKAAGQGKGKRGVSGSLKDAKSYDPLFGKIVSVWRDPETGRLLVVNGHNRLDLARRSGVQNILTWEIDAPNAEQARAIGAMENIAEGQGTAWDAAKIMRDMGIDGEEMARRNIDVTKGVAEKGVALSRLPQEIFEQGATGKLSLDKAVALGSVKLDDVVVRDVAAQAAKKGWPADKILQAMQEAKFAQTAEATGGGVLPGFESMFRTSNFEQLLDIRTEAFKALREEMVALTSVAREGRRGILEAAGNVVDVAGSQAARGQAAIAVEIFDRVTGYTGPVRDLLNEMAGQVSAKRSAKAIVTENLERLRAAIEAEGGKPRLPLEQPPAQAVAPSVPSAGTPPPAAPRTAVQPMGNVAAAAIEPPTAAAVAPPTAAFADPLMAENLADARQFLGLPPTANLDAITTAARDQGYDAIQWTGTAGTPGGKGGEIDLRLEPAQAPAPQALTPETKTVLSEALGDLPVERQAEIFQSLEDAGIDGKQLQERLEATAEPAIEIPAGASRKITDRTGDARIQSAAESLVGYTSKPGVEPMSIDQALDLVRAKGAILDPDAIPGLDMAKAREDVSVGRPTPEVAAVYQQFYGVNAQGGTTRGRISKTGLPGYASVGEGGRFIRRLRQLSNQLKDAEGAEAARIANEMQAAISDFTTPLWKRPVTVREELLAGLRADLQRVAGPNVKIKFERKIKLAPDMEAKMRKDWGIPDSVKSNQISLPGLYDPATNLIRLALADASPHELRGTGYHEVVHYLNDQLYTPQENAVLKAARPELEKIAAAGGLEDLASADDWEIIAEAAAVYSLNRDANLQFKVSPGVKGLFDRFIRLLDATKNWAAGNGFQTWEDVLKRGYSGEVGTRANRESMFMREGMQAGAADRLRAVPDQPEGPRPVEPGPGPENSDDWVRRFAQQLGMTKEQLLSGELTYDDLLANSFQKTQSPSGQTIYTATKEDLVDGYNAMSKVLPGRAELSGIPSFTREEVRALSQAWLSRHGEDGEAIMRGLSPLIRGFEDYQLGALNRAMWLADKKQVEASMEAAMWLNSASVEGLNQSERLARLITAAESARATHEAVMRVTRPWGQLGVEMQVPRNYDAPPATRVAEEVVPPAETIDIEEAITKELEIEGARPIEETITGKIDEELVDAANGGEITPKAQAAADALAQALVSAGAEPAMRNRWWRRFDDPALQNMGPNGLLMLRVNNLISSGVTATTNLGNGMLNLARFPLQQAGGALAQGEMKRAMYSMMMFQQYWMNLSNAMRVAGHSLKAGRSLMNMDVSTLDWLDRVAQREAQGELLSGPDAPTGWTINTVNMSQEMAQRPIGQAINKLWQVVGTGASRLAIGIDTFNSTLAGYAYEHVRHLPRGMELAAERGMKEFSADAWKFAQQYADARTQETMKSAVINGKNLADVAMESPQAQNFMNAINFTDNVWTELETRTLSQGISIGQSRGLAGNDLQAFAQKYVEEGQMQHRLANYALNGRVAFGRIGSFPGEAMQTLSNARGIGPIFKFIQPFQRVPSNIIKSAMRNTPAAVFVDTWWRDITSEDAFTRDRAIGEVAVGSAAISLVAMASGLGYIRFNGGGPLDYAAKDKWTNIEKRMPYSVQVWNDAEGAWSAPTSMRALEPFATLFGAIGDYTDIANSLSTESRNRLGSSLVLTLARMSTSGVLSKSYFQGFNELYEAAFNPSKIITGPAQRDPLARYLSRIVASMVPYSSSLRAARRETDPVSRTVDPSDIGGLMGFFQETLDEVRNAVPGWSNNLPARRDWINGAPILTQGILGAEIIPADMPWLQAAMQFTPFAAFQQGRETLGPVHEEMGLLSGKGTNFSGPRASDFGPEMRLTPSELEDYTLRFATIKDEYGLTFEQTATKLIESAQYQSWPVEGPSSRDVSLRAAAIQTEIQRFKKLAKEDFKFSTAKGQLIAGEEAAAEARKAEKTYIQRYGMDNSPQPAQPGAPWSPTPR